MNQNAPPTWLLLTTTLIVVALILFTLAPGCAYEVEDVGPDAGVSYPALHGLPSFYPVQTVCGGTTRQYSTTRIAEINTVFGSDVWPNKTMAAARAATQLRFRGEGDFECNAPFPDVCSNQRPDRWDRDRLCRVDCIDPATLNQVRLHGAHMTATRDYKARVDTYANGTVMSFDVLWKSSDYRFVLDVCTSPNKDPAVEFLGNRSSQDLVTIGWGGR